MKIGDGGLQGYAVHDDVVKRAYTEQQQQRPEGTEEHAKEEERGEKVAINENELNKAVEKLNENASVNNLPVEFSVNSNEESTSVEMRNTENNETREISPQELPRVMEGMENNTGVFLDHYF